MCSAHSVQEQMLSLQIVALQKRGGTGGQTPATQKSTFVGAFDVLPPMTQLALSTTTDRGCKLQEKCFLALRTMAGKVSWRAPTQPRHASLRIALHGTKTNKPPPAPAHSIPSEQLARGTFAHFCETTLARSLALHTTPIAVQRGKRRPFRGLHNDGALSQ